MILSIVLNIQLYLCAKPLTPPRIINKKILERMAKYYFQKDDENCYSLQYHKDFMVENQLNELQLFEAKVEYGTGYFFCKHFLEIGEKNNGCGKECEFYKPRNGKSGICSHSGNVYEQTEKSITINTQHHERRS